MDNSQFLAASTIINQYYPTLRKIMFTLAEQNIKGEITRHTEVGSITFKLKQYELNSKSTR